MNFEFKNSPVWKMACANCYNAYDQSKIGQSGVPFLKFEVSKS